MVMTSAMCLALAIYYEARGESISGQLAVAQVVMNRVADKRYPDTVCEVVMQPYQFSFVNEYKNIPIEQRANRLYQKITDKMAWRGAKSISNAFTGGHSINLNATHYHTTSVLPQWATSPRVEHLVTIGSHRFYRERG